ncbi:TetR family transcriptional regulator [Halorientalis sp. IM1011]|uniref:TetR/AcrR family transcriptional regulator n=1 Tax=Halorientalis sp. IM1011 TaxID=1932360 RepID=UPI00097CCD18|nr:TetR/AcrR family transcriptional regulator [Halorientalis sp. IM1011]AQL42134.1 TetR family transcriptional regulator [Halorientalis sp. IM1011]
MDDDSATEILEATYRALCRHGYADLTTGDIAAETDRSKGLIHYYYDSKENLFAEFLEFLYEKYTERLASATGNTPRAELFALFESLLVGEETQAGQEFRTAMLEVTAQAPYNAEIQTELARFDAALFDRVSDLVAAGVDVGEFDDRIDPETAAEFLVTTVTGVHTRSVAAGHSTEHLYGIITEYVETHLLVDDQAEAIR